MTLIDKIPPNLPLPAPGRENTPKGGITPLWQRACYIIVRVRELKKGYTPS